jgi:hypothetical protein
MQGEHVSTYYIRCYADGIAVESILGSHHRLRIAAKPSMKELGYCYTKKSVSNHHLRTSRSTLETEHSASNKYPKPNSCGLPHGLYKHLPGIRFSSPPQPPSSSLLKPSIHSIQNASLHHHSSRSRSLPPPPRLGRRLPKLTGRRKRAMRQIRKRPRCTNCV